MIYLLTQNNHVPLLIIVASLALISGYFVMSRYFPNLMDYIIEKSKKRGFSNGIWKTHLGVGETKTPKIEKAAIARIGLGANSSKETIYWSAFTDSDGDELNSKHNYKIVFNNDLPLDYQNKGFWSITVYGKNKFLVENKNNRYMIRNDNKMNENFEFPFVILLSNSHTEITGNLIPLPVNKEKFSLTLRCYRPLSQMTNKESSLQIKLPIIEKIEESKTE